MPLEGVNSVLSQLKRTQWQDQQSFAHLSWLWPEIVGPEVAAQTRPQKLTQQGILQVAVSSSVWAQNLSFERMRLLEKVNFVWNRPVRDIHFSTRFWSQKPPALPTLAEPANTDPAVHQGPRLPLKSVPKDAQDAFQRWASAVQSKAKHYQICPVCQCPAPRAELNRWQCCSLCAVRLQNQQSGPEERRVDEPK